MPYDCLNIAEAEGFEWDDGNRFKNERKHGIVWNRIEEIFFNEPLLVYEDRAHSQNECRCYALGRTDEGMPLFVVFTMRGKRIRVISARKMHKKERSFYEKAATEFRIGK
jgi:uncharacterized DUF497 family protein